jgi:short-subunit dehydrogenase
MSTTGGGTALITGASAGIGAIYADRLARRGCDLILVARNEGRLKELARRLTQETGTSVQTIAADLTDSSDVARVETILRTDPRITVLVNNAGLAAVTPLLASDVDAMDEMIQLNVVALTRLAYAAVPGFVARGAGIIINIASIVAIAPESLNGVYGASKAFVLAFSHSLRHELENQGVRVQAVLPGATATDLWAKAGRPVESLPAAMVMSADNMVDAALSGLDQGEAVTIPALADETDWDRYESARRAMFGKLSGAVPAPRYHVQANGSGAKATAATAAAMSTV